MPQLIMDGTKILSMTGESVLFGFLKVHAYELKEDAQII